MKDWTGNLPDRLITNKNFNSDPKFTVWRGHLFGAKYIRALDLAE
jgi:hypothetical protein